MKIKRFRVILFLCVTINFVLSDIDKKAEELKMLPLASPDPSFWNDLSRKRPKGGIDVTKHSKEARLFNIFSPASGESPFDESMTDKPVVVKVEVEEEESGPGSPPRRIADTSSIKFKDYEEPEEVATKETKKSSAKKGSNKPALKIGIVLPRQIFQQRRYQSIISKSLTEITQEKSEHGNLNEPFVLFSEEDEQEQLDEEKRNQSGKATTPRTSIFSKGSRGGLAKTLFRSTTEATTKKPTMNKRARSGSLLEHIRQTYNFTWNGQTFKLDDENDSINFGDLVVSPPPSDITDVLCQQLDNGSAAILYFTNTEKFGRSTAASQYFLQMAGFLGIPVIAWNADNTGLESRATYHLGTEMTGHLQLAPSVDHQVSAILSILDRYNWRQFGIVTSEVAGHGDFVQAVRDQVHAAAKHGRSRYTVQNVFKVSDSTNWDVNAIANSEVRIIILYCTQGEAALILEQAAKLGLTSHKYLWIVTQSVIGDPEDRSTMRRSLPIGMLGIHFEVDMERVLQSFVSLGLKVFFHAVDAMLERRTAMDGGQEQNSEAKKLFDYDLNCQGVNTSHRWENGPEFYRELMNITLTLKRDKDERRKIFKSDGSIRDTQLKVMNLKPVANQAATSGGIQMSAHAKWDEVGTWNTWNGLDIKDIVWPGNSHVPPQGVPEQFHMRITFLEEPPFIIISDPDPVTSKCSMNRGVPCWMNDVRAFHGEKKKLLNESLTDEVQDGYKCCSGFCIDLLTKFVDELGFTFDLVRVPDPKWGTFENGKWNGLMHELVTKNTDMVLSALKINAEREAVADFTVPFLESGIAIIVAKRTGIISPTAFLEPFDTYSWMLVALVAIQASTFSIFLFEWLSPSGYDMQLEPPAKTGHRFSLFRTYWLVWAVLFQAAVQVDCPRGLTARFMSAIWALFAVVFLALYTANLAAFMIPRKEFHNLEGLDDSKIKNPHSQKPSLKFGTIPYSYSEVTLKKYFPDVFSYMKPFNKYNTTERAMRAVKEGEFDAFIYDGTVLNYLASQDEECRLLQVGTWSAMTGYALAFPVHSKYRAMFNEKLLELRENGDLERLGRFWMSGTCKPNEQEKRASEPLSIAQFLSAFLLLGIGTLISVILFLLEHLYMRYLRNHIVDKAKGSTKAGALCSLLSQSIGQSYFKSSQENKNRESEYLKEINLSDTGHRSEDAYSDDYDDRRCNGINDEDDSSQCPSKNGKSEKRNKKKRKRHRTLTPQDSIDSNSLNQGYFTNRLSCQDAQLCDGQLTNLHSELEDAKKQIRFLENLLCQYNKEIDNDRDEDLFSKAVPEEIPEDVNKTNEGGETDQEVNRMEEEGLMWLDDLPPLPLSPEDACPSLYSDEKIEERFQSLQEIEDRFQTLDDVDDRFQSLVSIEPNGDVIIVKHPFFRGAEIEEKETVL